MKKRGAIGWPGRTREKSIGLDNSFASACFLPRSGPFLVPGGSKVPLLVVFLACRNSIETSLL